jgi:hypothetical protein
MELIHIPAGTRKSRFTGFVDKNPGDFVPSTLQNFLIPSVFHRRAHWANCECGRRWNPSICLLEPVNRDSRVSWMPMEPLHMPVATRTKGPSEVAPSTLKNSFMSLVLHRRAHWAKSERACCSASMDANGTHPYACWDACGTRKSRFTGSRNQKSPEELKANFLKTRKSRFTGLRNQKNPVFRIGKATIRSQMWHGWKRS